MASVFLIPDATKRSADEPGTNKWATLVAVVCVVGIALIVLGLEYWIAHEHGEKMGVFSTIAAPVYGILKGASMVVTNSASVVANGAIATIGAAGRVGKVIES